MDKELYILIQCGYEGIDTLVCPLYSAEEAIKKITEKREFVNQQIARRKEVAKRMLDDEESWEDNEEWSEMMKREEITYDEWEAGLLIDPDAYCIYKWDGKRFSCVCDELKVNPSKTWLMG